ncbi:MAG: prenyltransferase/squalene oxidase repeat-containing protein, partial [Phycisphaerales bacterium]
MSEKLDAYYKWLGIPPEEQPPNYYRLLGIKLFESDREVIDTAVARQSAHLRTYQLGKHLALSQQLLTEVHVAKSCLIDPKKKARYDAELREKLRTAASGIDEESLDPDLTSVLAAAGRAKHSAARSAAPSFKTYRLAVAAAVAGGIVLLVLGLVVRSGSRGKKDVAPVAMVPKTVQAESDKPKAESDQPAAPTAPIANRRPEAKPTTPAGEPAAAPSDATRPETAKPAVAAPPAAAPPPTVASPPSPPAVAPAASSTAGAEKPAGDTPEVGMSMPKASDKQEAPKPVVKAIPAFENPFDCRKTGVRQTMLEACGGNEQSEQAVTAALGWLARHQDRDGSWSLQSYDRRCKGASCTGLGSVNSDSAATALALLPFLAAGQSHKTSGPHKAVISKGLFWLVKNQKRDGSLWGNSDNKMYTHGLASITLCEAYGLTGDKKIGQAAQTAINFIQSAQHPRTGGWRYNPGDEGDTSVAGWQVQALESAQAAGLKVLPRTLAGARHWLSLCASGRNRGLYSYTPGSGPSPSMTAIGLLLSQYRGTTSDDPSMKEGVGYLMSMMPNASRRVLYYWYYATLV